MKSIFRWLSKDQLPAYIDSYHKMNLWVRKTGANRQAVALLNSSLDPAENVELMIRTDREEITVYDMNCKSTTITRSAEDSGYREFILPKIRPWEMVMVCDE